MKVYQNYHTHKHGSNIFTADSAITIKDYAKRCKELGHQVISSMEHGFQGLYFDAYKVTKDKDFKDANLKFIYSVEAYWVKDRYEKDATNSHMCLIAKTDKGRKALNLALSEANETGYHYKPRLDLDLILNLPADDIFVTSACVAFWKYDDIDEIVLKLHNHFKDNFRLEVQYQPFELQQQVNAHIIELSREHGIGIIAGMDSHYIHEDQKVDREDVLLSKGIKYDNEDDFFMDYPDYDTAFQRFVKQGVLSIAEITDALDATNEILDFDNFDGIDIFSNRIKLPTLYPDLTQEQKNQKLKDIITENWKKLGKRIPKGERNKYKTEIRKEMQIIIDTNMADYFLLDYEIVKEALKNGGMMTPSGRGSGVSFYINTLLGFSKIDRIVAPVKMFPERFMSVSRILDSGSLPDIDMNVGNPEVFTDAQRMIVGASHAFPMVAWGKFKAKSAWKMYAKAEDVPFDIANEVSAQIDKYEEDLKNASEDEKDTVDIYDYIDEQYHEMYDATEVYRGIIATKSPHPCAWLIYDRDIREEIGLIRVTSDSTKKSTIVCLMDGKSAESYSFLKNDWLKVDVVKFFYKIAEKINEEIPDERQLMKICAENPQIWDIYARGATVGVNQMESIGTSQKATRYRPKDIGELCALIAAIRPSFKSMYSIFESREYFEYGIPTFDNLIQSTGLDSSFVLYQETIMAALEFAGFEAGETYTIVKYISKKKEEELAKIKPKFIEGFKKAIIENDGVSEEEALISVNKVWAIIEDAGRYGFNASHSYSYAFDSLLCAYYKTLHTLEFYETLLEEYSQKGNKNKVALLKREMHDSFGIKIQDVQFGHDNRRFTIDREKLAINESILSIKYLSSNVANDLFQLSQDNKYDNFYNLLLDIKNNTCVQANQLEILIKIGYFREFGGAKKMVQFYKIFDEFYERVEFRVSSTEPHIIELVKDYCTVSPTGKTYGKFRYDDFLTDIFNKMPNQEYSVQQRIIDENTYLGYIKTTIPNIGETYAIVTDFEHKYTHPMIYLYYLNSGKTQRVKVKNYLYEKSPIHVHDMLNIHKVAMEGRWKTHERFIAPDNEKGFYQDWDDKEPILKEWGCIKA